MKILAILLFIGLTSAATLSLRDEVLLKEGLDKVLEKIKGPVHERKELTDKLLLREDRESRSLKDYWEKVKNYFKDLKIDLQEKYIKFGEWVKDNLRKGMDASKDKIENIRAIAKEFAKHAKNVSKEIGAEASEFFRQYKDDLGNIWDELKETFKEIRERKERR